MLPILPSVCRAALLSCTQIHQPHGARLTARPHTELKVKVRLLAHKHHTHVGFGQHGTVPTHFPGRPRPKADRSATPSGGVGVCTEGGGPRVMEVTVGEKASVSTAFRVWSGSVTRPGAAKNQELKPLGC